MGYSQRTESKSTYVVRYPEYRDADNFPPKIVAARKACREATTMDQLVKAAIKLNRLVH